ncbi:MAG: DEAD/DEAH box helicase [Trueperaceae bacterium]|nr:DEAD/DEAH box helicase [Trueperaceae bacterium]
MSTEASFDAFELDRRVMTGVRNAGYTVPTPIQQQTIAEALKGRHVLGLAQTGTGKTAAFVLPILNRLVTDFQPGKKYVRALVVAPTRELAEQINDEFKRLGAGTGVKSATVYGGVGFQPQMDALRGRVDVVVACPGRLIDLMQRGVADLSRVEVLVLDEADHMFDMGFLPSVKQIVAKVPHHSQRLLFSATMPSEVRHLADSLLDDPLQVEIGHSAPAETIEHFLIPVDEEQKTELLLHLLRTDDHRSTLVFTRTKHRAKRLAATLDKQNIFAAEIQGNLSQRRRQEALDGFKDGTYHVLVATDIAARGIDVARVSHVINYDFPDTPEAYTHRIGRTGRASRAGQALTFVTHHDFANVRVLERLLAMRIPRREVEGFGGQTVLGLRDLKPGGDSRFTRAAGGRSQQRSGAQRSQRPGGGGSQQRLGSGASQQRPSSGGGQQRPGSSAVQQRPRPSRSDSGDGEARRSEHAPRPAQSAADTGASGVRRRRRRRGPRRDPGQSQGA